jgi:hypothetical protein
MKIAKIAIGSILCALTVGCKTEHGILAPLLYPNTIMVPDGYLGDWFNNEKISIKDVEFVQPSAWWGIDTSFIHNKKQLPSKYTASGKANRFPFCSESYYSFFKENTDGTRELNIVCKISFDQILKKLNPEDTVVPFEEKFPSISAGYLARALCSSERSSDHTLPEFNHYYNKSNLSKKNYIGIVRLEQKDIFEEGYRNRGNLDKLAKIYIIRKSDGKVVIFKHWWIGSNSIYLGSSLIPEKAKLSGDLANIKSVKYYRIVFLLLINNMFTDTKKLDFKELRRL